MDVFHMDYSVKEIPTLETSRGDYGNVKTYFRVTENIIRSIAIIETTNSPKKRRIFLTAESLDRDIFVNIVCSFSPGFIHTMDKK
ncbi:Hypothetical predicted protein [Octopus vulgaris]|uniref:Uncharacterized protein n=1 Tax=Octopus vulgaris TaxID=6645 RepID=A0AA36AJP1_OCTVU|nr:Hypothetical predicted protein [Octopus vulgaris]